MISHLSGFLTFSILVTECACLRVRVLQGWRCRPVADTSDTPSATEPCGASLLEIPRRELPHLLS